MNDEIITISVFFYRFSCFQDFVLFVKENSSFLRDCIEGLYINIIKKVC